MRVRRLVLMGLLFSGGLIGTTLNDDSVRAAENNEEEIATQNQVTYPMYEVNEKYKVLSTNKNHPLNKNATFSVGENNLITFPKEISGGEYGTDKNATYVLQRHDNDTDLVKGYFDPETGLSYFDSEKKEPISELFLIMTSYQSTIKYVDQDSGEVVGQINKKLDIDPFYRDIRLDEREAPSLYTMINPVIEYKIGDSLDELKVPVKKIDMSKLPEVTPLIIRRFSKGSATNGEYIELADNDGAPYNLKPGQSITDIINSMKNPDYKPQIVKYGGTLKEDMNDGSGIIDEPLDGISKEAFEATLPQIWKNMSLMGGSIINGTIDVYYDYNDDPENGGSLIPYDVEIPSNLDGKVDVPTVKSEGKLGQTVDVKVPDVKGYTLSSDSPKIVKATVQADGTITVNDGQKITYVKDVTTSGGSNNTNTNVDTSVTTDVNVKVAALHDADLYDNNGNKLDNQSISKYATNVADKKMVKDDVTYYQINDGKWVKADDVYLYEDFNGYIRTYLNSNKGLIKTDNTEVGNRVLAPASDWFSDRMRLVNGVKYYRVATDEWVSQNDAFEYQPNPTTVKVLAGSTLYTERGKAVRETTKDMDFISDRIAEINGQKMYRVASDEYVLVSDVAD